MPRPQAPARKPDERYCRAPCARSAPPPHICHHLPPRRGQDHADRETAAVLRRDPDRRQRQGAQGQPPCHLRLDGDREAARHLGGLQCDADGVPRLRHQPARHPRPPGLLGRHLSRADRGGRGADGHRRSQRRRAADAAAAAGVPRAQYADPDLRQQDGPRGQGAAGPVRRDRVRAGHERGAIHLAGGHGQGLRRRARPAARPDARVLAGRRPGQGCRRDHRRHRQPGAGRALRHGLRAGGVRGTAGARGRAGLRRGRVPGRATDTDVLRQRHQQLRRPGGTGRPGRAGAAAGPEGRAATRGAAHRAQVQRRGIQDPGQHGPGAPRPHRLPARGQRPLRARHAAEGGAQRQGAAAEYRGLLPEPEARAAGRSLRRRHHRHPQPRRAAARRHPHRGRGAAVHRPALLRAGDVPLGGSGRPAAHQAAARRPDAAGRGRRDPGLPPGGRQHAAARRGGAAAVRGRGAPAGA